jgi:hypothetical protein
VDQTRPLVGAAALRVADLAEARRPLPATPTSEPRHDNRLAREAWRNLSMDIPWIDGLSLISRVVPSAFLVQTTRRRTPLGCFSFAPSWSAVPRNVLAVPDAVSFGGSVFLRTLVIAQLRMPIGCLIQLLGFA